MVAWEGLGTEEPRRVRGESKQGFPQGHSRLHLMASQAPWCSTRVQDKPQPLEISDSWEILLSLPTKLQEPFTKSPPDSQGLSMSMRFFSGVPTFSLIPPNRGHQWPRGLLFSLVLAQPRRTSTFVSGVSPTAEMPHLFLCLTLSAEIGVGDFPADSQKAISFLAGGHFNCTSPCQTVSVSTTQFH